MEKIICTKSFTVRGVDGNDLSMSETVEGDHVILSIQQNDDKGRFATARLNKASFDAFFEKKYSMEIVDKGITDQ